MKVKDVNKYVKLNAFEYLDWPFIFSSLKDNE